MKYLKIFALSLLFQPIFLLSYAGENELFSKGKLLYESTMQTLESVDIWKMEGRGKVEFSDGWMHMFSPDEKMHHVYWCPENFPGSFIAEWEVRNIDTDAGLCIVFFASKGENGEDIFDPSLPKRNGDFKQYTRGKIVSYHISYYAYSPDKALRNHANLRKNNNFILVQKGEEGIPVKSKAIHKIRLIKDNAHILMFIDNRKIIDWTDDGRANGRVLTGGKIGFRQMRRTHFDYRNFKVWSLQPKTKKAKAIK